MKFQEFNITTPLYNALMDNGFVEATPIQQKVFPVVMSGRDVVGIAQTGTGKTIAYLLPCIKMWKYSGNGLPQILIMVPTRELVLQVVEQVNKLTSYMNVVTLGIFGGVNTKPQLVAIANGVDVLVATPGRLFDLALTGVLRLKQIKKLIIDEVDEMLNLGFRPQLTSIFELLPPKRQNLMFSATITQDIEELTIDFFNNPIKIEAAPTGTPLENIKQIGYELPNFYTKINFLIKLLNNKVDLKKVLIFVSTKKLADDVYELIQTNFPNQLGVIHSNKAQNNRFNSVRNFNAGACRILIATDIMARGIDITDISHVINFDFPDSPENYMHRIGRTGRADKEGIAITFILEKDAEYREAAETLMNVQIPIEDLPEDLDFSKELTEDEKPKVHMINYLDKLPKKAPSGPAFHTKLAKNVKTNSKVPHKELMMIKYGKKKTRGQKKTK